jgi:UDP-N-acetylmuramoyl-L-alanyl-D-glutamate--2,6-diaminopimelate ligase
VRLSELARAVGGRVSGGDPDVRGITGDSRRASAGDLFVAITGAQADGLRFVPQALAGGAVAVCAREPVDGTPTLVVADPRRALALLSAELNGHPARRLHLIGVTGSLGKTSTSLLARTALEAGGHEVGLIGSLGVRFGEHIVETGMTTPEAPSIHGALRRMLADGATTAVMEVTSHSILLERVAGIEFALGVLTNLVPDEHLEFHPTPEHYIETKARFFGMLAPGAPLLANLDDRIGGERVRRLDRPVVGVSSRGAPDAALEVRDVRMTVRGSRFRLRVRRALTGIEGGTIEPTEVEVRLPILGLQQVENAALALGAAILAEVPPDAAAAALARAEPMRRRMQLVREEDPAILDDTVGNPRSIDAVFDAVRLIRPAEVRVAYVLRGMRGETINRRNARAIADGARAVGATLVVSASEDVADERNRVTDEERDAALAELHASGVPFAFEPRLRDAIRRALDGAHGEALVVLLGAQGMDRGAELAREALAGRPR